MTKRIREPDANPPVDDVFVTVEETAKPARSG
jgi:hypothetical protein